MGTAFLYGNGASGAGGGLNFKVVGGTSTPSNPKENTIWVNTDVPISAWAIGDFPNPSWPMTEGWVYIDADTSEANRLDFNALKKNEIWIQPISAKQYVGGTWVNKEAKIYQGGAWVEWWSGQLLTGHNTYDNVTGGYAWVSNKAATVTLTNDGIVLGHTSSGDEAEQCSNVYTKNAIDLSKYSTIEVTYIAANKNKMVIAVDDTKPTSVNLQASAFAAGVRTDGKDVGSTNTVSLDVSALTGNYYVIYGIKSLTITSVVMK